MSADASAYAVLGLEPGADAAEIARAYKKLIKQFHPDREGGDARRAAEINRAYRELRLAGQVKEPLDLEHWDSFAEGDRRVRTAVVLLAAAGAVTLVVGPMVAFGLAAHVPARSALVRKTPQPSGEAMAQPIFAREVEGAVGDALRISQSGDEMALTSASRDCQTRLRQRPEIARLDRCAAFDAAVVQLLDRDPLRDRGPFSEIAVTGRQMSAATMFSNDYLAIDSRLDAIRLRVELALAARAQPEVAAPEPADD